MAKLRLDELIAQHSLKWTKPRRTLVKFIPYDESLDAQATTHAETIYLLPDESAPSLMRTLVLMAKVVQENIVPDGMSIWQANGQVGGQEIPHLHFHSFPRYQGDRHLNIYPDPPEEFAMAQRLKLADQLKTSLKEIQHR